MPFTAPPPDMSQRRSLDDALAAWLAAGGSRIGEIIIRPAGDGAWLLRHHADADADAATLARQDSPEALRELAKWDAAGQYRPLRSAPNLRSGWEARLPDISSLRLALDFLYPAALANWLRWLDGHASPCSLRETFNRQTGMYRVTGLIRDEEAQTLVASACADANCSRRVLWNLDGSTPWHGLPAEKTAAPRLAPEAGAEIPLLCLDLCPLLLGAARETVKKRMKAESEAAKSGDTAPAAS